MCSGLHSGAAVQMRVVVTGLGVITPLGNTADSLWSALLNGECATRQRPDLATQGFRVLTACRVSNFHCYEERRGQGMAVAAARQAIADAQVPLTSRIGVYVGTTLGESIGFERIVEGASAPFEDITANIF